jgi:hypothetical protein
MSKDIEITIRPTDELVETPRGTVVRIWKGSTLLGVRVHVFVAGIGVEHGQDDETIGRFEQSLREMGDIRYFLEFDGSPTPPPSIN